MDHKDIETRNNPDPQLNNPGYDLDGKNSLAFAYTEKVAELGELLKF